MVAKNSSPTVFAFDHGYSEMKAIGDIPVQFPTYILPYEKAHGTAKNAIDSLVYIDEKGDRYHVGNSAFQRIQANEGLANMKEKMDRYYFKKNQYLIAYRMAVALAYPTLNKFRIPMVVTGLPSEFMDDAEELEEIIRGKHSFTIEYGGQPRTVTFTADSVVVIPQPYGTLCLFAFDDKGRVRNPAVLEGYTRIDDWGFKTTDSQLTSGGQTIEAKCFSFIGEDETTSECYKKISQEIRKMTGKHVPFFLISDLVKKGVFEYQDDNLENQTIEVSPIADPIFKKASLQVMKKVLDPTGVMKPDHYIVSGGGSGIEAILKEYKRVYPKVLYPQMEDIHVDPAFANAYGYRNFGMNGVMAGIVDPLDEMEGIDGETELEGVNNG